MFEGCKLLPIPGAGVYKVTGHYIGEKVFIYKPYKVYKGCRTIYLYWEGNVTIRVGMLGEVVESIFRRCEHSEHYICSCIDTSY